MTFRVHKFVKNILQKIFFGSFITCILKGYIRLTLRSMSLIKSVSDSLALLIRSWLRLSRFLSWQSYSKRRKPRMKRGLAGCWLMLENPIKKFKCPYSNK